jgi:thioredoxin-like negative regulator of GroEL
VRGRRPGHGDGRREAQLRDVSSGELELSLREEERLVLVVFWTPGCEPCRELRSELAALRTDTAAVLAVNADQQPMAVRRHGVGQYPTLVFYKHGRELRRLRGGALPASTIDLVGSDS